MRNQYRQSVREEEKMKKALVCGAGGFIGHHMVTRLKKEGFWVRKRRLLGSGNRPEIS